MKFYALLANVNCAAMVFNLQSRVGVSDKEKQMLNALGYKPTTINNCLYDYIEQMCYDLAGAYKYKHDDLGCDSSIVRAARDIDKECNNLSRKIDKWKDNAQKWGGGCAPNAALTKVNW